MRQVLAQVWPLLNLMQLLTALPLLAVMMPANVLLINDLIIRISNAKVVPDSTLNDLLVKPIFDSDE